MSLDTAKSLLEQLWQDADYLASTSVLYDVSKLDALPDVNEMLALSRFVLTRKRDRGPKSIAFVAPEFGERSMKNVFAGFTKIIGLDMKFCGTEERAREMLLGRSSAA